MGQLTTAWELTNWVVDLRRVIRKKQQTCLWDIPPPPPKGHNPHSKTDNRPSEIKNKNKRFCTNFKDYQSALVLIGGALSSSVKLAGLNKTWKSSLMRMSPFHAYRLSNDSWVEEGGRRGGVEEGQPVRQVLPAQTCLLLLWKGVQWHILPWSAFCCALSHVL